VALAGMPVEYGIGTRLKNTDWPIFSTATGTASSNVASTRPRSSCLPLRPKPENAATMQTAMIKISAD